MAKDNTKELNKRADQILRSTYIKSGHKLLVIVSDDSGNWSVASNDTPKNMQNTCAKVAAQLSLEN